MTALTKNLVRKITENSSSTQLTHRLDEGRNAMLARHVELATGKKRTTEQIKSHLQVLQKRKQRRVTQEVSPHAASTTH